MFVVVCVVVVGVVFGYVNVVVGVSMYVGCIVDDGDCVDVDVVVVIDAVVANVCDVADVR